MRWSGPCVRGAHGKGRERRPRLPALREGSEAGTEAPADRRNNGSGSGPGGQGAAESDKEEEQHSEEEEGRWAGGRRQADGTTGPGPLLELRISL